MNTITIEVQKVLKSIISAFRIIFNQSFIFYTIYTVLTVTANMLFLLKRYHKIKKIYGIQSNILNLI